MGRGWSSNEVEAFLVGSGSSSNAVDDCLAGRGASLEDALSGAGVDFFGGGDAVAEERSAARSEA